MKKLLLTSVALTALFGGSAFAADLRPAYSAAAPARVQLDRYLLGRERRLQLG
jgi:hypothetical protein